MIEQPLVSIAIPAFSAQFLRRTLYSAISQSYPNLEVIVCDDSNADEVKAIVDELMPKANCTLRYVRNPQTLGFARNLQVCLEQSRGNFIKFLCDDDWLMDGCIDQMAQVLVDCPDVSLVVNHRLICAANEMLLPMRPANCIIAPCSAVMNGGDLLESLETNLPDLFGGVSHSMMRRDQVEAVLAQLVQGGDGFRARLVEALYICLLRRGHLAYLNTMLSLERVHVGRLSHQSWMLLAHKAETEWLAQMLASRTSEPAPAPGWVRYLSIEKYDEGDDKAWEEFELNRVHGRQMAGFERQVGTRSLSFDEMYSEWLSCRELSSGQLGLLSKRISQWPRRPPILVVVLAPREDAAALKATLASLEQQSYAPSRVCVLADAGLRPSSSLAVDYLTLQGNGIAQLNACVAQAGQGDWVFLVEAGDSLHPHALVVMAERMALQANSLCLYIDEGTDDNLQASQPIFKPDFNLDLMRSFPFVGRLLAFDCATLLEEGGFDPAFDVLAPQDMLWRIVERQGLRAIGHIAELLVQCRDGYGAWQRAPACVEQAPRILRAHLQRLGVEAELVSAEGSTLSRVLYQHADTPGVSIIIAAGQDLNALRRCVESVFEFTDYGNYEILIVADGQEPADVQGWLEAMRGLGSDQLRILELPGHCGPALYNQASLQARGSYLLFLKSNSLCFDAQWLGELVRQGLRPEVAVVAPKFCNSSGVVVEAGLILGLHGIAASPFIGHTADSNGYMNRLASVQNLSAVNDHCMLVRRELFSELGGLDAAALPDEFADADFCLRVREQGYLVVWTPFAVVAQMATPAPVKPSSDSQKLERDQDIFYERWLPTVADDPAYNRNLSLRMSSFNIEPGLRSGWDPFLNRVLPFVTALPLNTSAVGHYRVTQPHTELERAGWIQGQLSYTFPNLIELERQKPDVIILQCRYMAESLDEFERLKRFSSARRIYEIDDYIIEVPERNEHRRNMPDNMRELVSRGIAMCDRLVVSTQPLADALSSMHHDIRVVPNMLARELWDGLKSKRQTTARPRVGWAGGSSHRGDLELLVDVIKTLADQVDWVFFGMCPALLRPYIKEFHAGVPLHLYPQKLASLNLDLALAPLEVNLFNDCKSNLRLLEYGACGFPVICTNTKAYGGYLPCTRVASNATEHWLEAIRMHLADPQASYRQGDALREVVLRDYVLNTHNLQQWANGWLAD
ncbi:glycosyltransferase [Pseudomonas fontis]|uniref:Glycosyltransferase n=1 Tax=Pseudomonas fontis TaxID=2942633 RepID=A0ABT5NQQ8_9PSED|nr:glycosyltransferase [Pseudomonas fontis]MDD0974554.1 glycosyltransferase [Pseudomonas fontis]MDD0990503.1 glycosyltransferase [Pseudomonas fontis]